MVSFIFSGLLCSLAVAAPSKLPPSNHNAALYYYQAMLLQGRETTELLRNWDTVLLNDDAEKLIKNLDEVHDYLQAGANVTRCDWGFDLNRSIIGRVPYLESVRPLSHGLLLRARWHFSKHQNEKAFQDIYTVLQFARHSASTHIPVCKLVQYSVEQQALQLAASHLDDPKVVGNFVKRLHQLPATEGMKNILCEKEKQNHLIGLTKQRYSYIEQLLDLDSQGEQFQKTFESLRKANDESFLKNAARELEAIFYEINEVYAQPIERCQSYHLSLEERLTEMRDRGGIDEVMATYLRTIRPPLVSLKKSDMKNEVLWLLFRAAADVALNGKESIKNHKDPYGEGPFRFIPREKGFELYTALKTVENDLILLKVTTAP
jgi:hypothetical protein